MIKLKHGHSVKRRQMNVQPTGATTERPYRTLALLLLTAVAYLRGTLGDAPKDFLAPKLRLKSRLTWYYCYLILRKITKFVATRWQILTLKCTKFNFS